MDIAVFLVLVGLRGGDGKTNIAVKLHHGQFCHLLHGRMALLDTDEEIYIGLFRTMDDEVITFKATVCDDERLIREGVSLQHFHQRTDFVFLWLQLNDDIGKCAVENIMPRGSVELIHPFGDTVVLDEGRRGGIAGKIDRRTIYR